MKTISAVIITINNKDVVNAIDSVRSSCSQIVVVDTGSTQEHLGFLKQIEGIELHYFKWCEDFSAARNYGLQFANGDYILTIDSDEVLEKQIHADKLEKDFYFVRQVSEKHSDVWSARLFKNKEGYYYENLVHETIEQYITNDNYENTNIVLNHSGYSLNANEYNEKVERNFRLMLRDKKNKVRNFHLGNFYFIKGNLRKSIKHYKKALNDEINNEHKAMIYNNLYSVINVKGYWLKNPLEYLYKSIAIFPYQLQARVIIVEYLMNNITVSAIPFLKKQLETIKNIYENKLSKLQCDIKLTNNYFQLKTKELNKWQYQ